MADECDINRIMAGHRATGLIDHVNQYEGRYGDFSDVQDYQASMQQIIRAQDMFLALPSEVRSTFNNSPAEFLDFVNDPENTDAMREMGLLPHSSAQVDEPATPGVPDHKIAEKAPDASKPAEPAEKTS